MVCNLNISEEQVIQARARPSSKKTKRKDWKKRLEYEAKYNREWRARNLEQRLEYERKWREKNRDKIRAYQKTYYKSHPDFYWKRSLRQRYGLTVEDYERMLKLQGGKCALCGALPPQGRNKHLAVDHCHKTGVIRGLLCYGCNGSLARIEDSEWMNRANKYLKKAEKGGKE